MEKQTFYTFDRRGSVVKVEKPTENCSEELKNWWSCLYELRGVYKTEQEAKIASEPIIVNTGPDSYYYM